MSKTSGGTRGRLPFSGRWSGRDDKEAVESDGVNIFEKEARSGLGDFMSHKPTEVSITKYYSLLASGDYIEIKPTDKRTNIEKLFNGDYSVDRHRDGFGYSFGMDNIVAGDDVALIKKSDILVKKDVYPFMKERQELYIGRGISRNGTKISETTRNQLYGYSAAAAKMGSKVYASEEDSNRFLIIDRSALIVKRRR